MTWYRYYNTVQSCCGIIPGLVRPSSTPAARKRSTVGHDPKALQASKVGVAGIVWGTRGNCWSGGTPPPELALLA